MKKIGTERYNYSGYKFLLYTDAIMQAKEHGFILIGTKVSTPERHEYCEAGTYYDYDTGRLEYGPFYYHYGCDYPEAHYVSPEEFEKELNNCLGVQETEKPTAQKKKEKVNILKRLFHR